MREPKQLAKKEFIDRVLRRADRYKAKFGERRLDEWIKQGLAFKGDRQRPTGRRQVYGYGHRHYRRALQLIRLHARGIRDTDEMLIQLFICRYSTAAHEIREALRQEYRKARNKLNASVRSTYADRGGQMPIGRKKQFGKQLGPPDGRLLQTGMVPAEDFLLALARVARSPDTHNFESLIKLFGSGGQFMRLPLNAVVGLFAGMLMQDDQHPTEAELIITRGGAREYQQALCLFESVRKAFGVLASIQHKTIAETCNAIHMSLLSREMAAFFLVGSLKLVAGEST